MNGRGPRAAGASAGLEAGEPGYSGCGRQRPGYCGPRAALRAAAVAESLSIRKERGLRRRFLVGSFQVKRRS